MFDLRVVEVVISLLAGLGAVGAGVRVADYEVKRICFHCRRICKHFHQLWTPGSSQKRFPRSDPGDRLKDPAPGRRRNWSNSVYTTSPTGQNSPLAAQKQTAHVMTRP